MKKIFILLLTALLCDAQLTLGAQQRMSFRNGKFKVAQFTDLHWDSRSAKRAETEAVVRSVLEQERPDVAVLTGDVVTENPAEQGWNEVIAIFNDTKTPFVVMMGNHDAERMAKNDIYNMLLKSPYYIGEKGPEEIAGCGNCVLPVYGSCRKDKVEALLYCIDSNDYPEDKIYGHYDRIHFNQIDWYRRQSECFTQANGGQPLPALAFFHIPLTEYNMIDTDGKTYGTNGEGMAAASDINSGMFASFVDKKDVMGVFVGHDHDNDYIGIHKRISLAFGRVSGIDAYGDLKRGARIIRMYEGCFKFDSWITTLAGREDIYYYPSGLNSEEERTSEYSPAVNTSNPRPGVAYTYYEGTCKRVGDIASCAEVKRGVMKNFSLAEAGREDHFAYEFRTLVRIPEKGVYRFYTFTDDGSALYIDGKLVVDNDGGHSERRAEGKIALEKGFHELRLLYFEDYMGQALEVGVSGRNLPEIPLTDNMLFLPQSKK